jgi:hypothetical protein
MTSLLETYLTGKPSSNEFLVHDAPEHLLPSVNELYDEQSLCSYEWETRDGFGGNVFWAPSVRAMLPLTTSEKMRDANPRLLQHGFPCTPNDHPSLLPDDFPEAIGKLFTLSSLRSRGVPVQLTIRSKV